MEDVEAVPTPFVEDKEQDKPETDSEEVTEFEAVIDKIYLFSATKKGRNIIFRVKTKDAFIPVNYELIYDSNDMNKLSKIFILCSNIDEIYHVLIGGLKNNSKEINIELINDKAVCKFILDNKVLDRKENYTIILTKKKVNLNADVLNEQFIKINEKQKELEEKLEKKIDEINLIAQKQSQLQEEFNQKMKEIEEIKKCYNEYMALFQNNRNKLNEFEKSQNNIKSELDLLKKEITQNNNEDIKEEIEEIKDLIENQKVEVYNSIEKANKNIQSLSQNSLELKKSINNINLNINTIQENQKLLFSKDDNNDKIDLKIEQINLNSQNSIKKLVEENEKMMKNIKDLTNDYNLLNKKVADLIEVNGIPINFEFKKTISTDLFKKNFYNNRACIFISCKDQKVYIAYGESSLNLEGYDVSKNEKFTIYEELHEDFFDSLRHFYDEINDRDLLITASLDSHVKVIEFNLEESEIIIDLNFKSQIRVIINTAYFLNDMIIVPFSKNGTVKIYNMDEECISNIQNLGFILGLNTYSDKDSKTNYILVANLEGIFSYNMEKNSLKKFIPTIQKEKDNNGFDEPYIIKKGKKLLLLGPCFYHPYLYIWNFLDGDLINTIETPSGISDICLWNNYYAFAALVKSQNQNFILIDIKRGEIVKEFKKEVNNSCAGIKIINHKNEKYLITSNIKGNLDLYS